MRRIALASAALLVAACATARSPARDPVGPPVREVRIEGTHRLGEAEVARKLALRAPAPWPWSDTQPFDPVMWDLDLRRIERVYESEGFYGTRVVDSEVRREPDGVHLRAVVREADPTIVRQLHVTGTDSLPPELARDLLAGLRIREGDRFREERWEASKRNLRRTLLERGYAQAKVDGRVVVRPDEHRADVTLRLDPGRVYRFGSITVAGEPGGTMPSGPVLETAREAMPEGRRYSLDALTVAQDRVFALGGFSAVAVSAGEPAPGSDRVPILVELRDAPKYALRLGGGFAADTSRQEVRAVAEGVDRDFLGALRVLRLRATAGAAFVPTAWGAFGGGAAQRWGPVASLVADFGQPVTFGLAGLSLFASTEAGTAPREGWSEASVRGEAGFVWRLGQRATVQASYALEKWHLFDTELSGAGAPVTSYGCSGPCLLSYLEQRLTIDRRDDERDTRRGQLVHVLAREFVGALGSSYGGTELSGQLSAFVPVWRNARTILAGRVRAGALLGGGAPPVMLRFFSGGNEMRGFGNRQLAPRLAVEPGASGALPVGGRAILDGTLEARWSTGTPVALVGFMDAGAVTAERFDLTRLLDGMHVALGAGIRWRTRIAPIRLDFAWLLPVGGPLPTYDQAGGRVPTPRGGGCFGLGGGGSGDPEGQCAIHIWIGEAF